MIYISKINNTEIITDNIVNFIPDLLQIYLDDIYIGEFENLSDNKNFLRFIMPTLELDEREYILKIYTHNALIKREIIIVLDFLSPEFKSVEKIKTIKMYEG